MAQERTSERPPAAQSTQGERTAEDRREILKKLGRLGLYTAPAMLIAFESAKAQALPSRRL